MSTSRHLELPWGMSVDGQRRSPGTLPQRLRGATSRKGSKTGALLLFAISQGRVLSNTHTCTPAHTESSRPLEAKAFCRLMCSGVAEQGLQSLHWAEGRRHRPRRQRQRHQGPTAPCQSLAAPQNSLGGGLKHQKCVFSQFCGLGVLDHGVSVVEFWQGPSSWPRAQ